MKKKLPKTPYTPSKTKWEAPTMINLKALNSTLSGTAGLIPETDKSQPTRIGTF